VPGPSETGSVARNGERNPKKSGGVLREEVDLRYAWVNNHCDSYDVKTLCRVLEVSRSGYYRWLRAEPSETQRRVERIGVEAKRAFEENHGTVGYRKVYKQQAAEGVACCPETVRKTLTRQGLHASIAPKFVPATTDSDHNLPIAENLLARNFTATRPNQKWVSDITYIRTGEGWLYLAVVIDLFSRKVVGWAMADQMRVNLVLEAFEMAVMHRRPTFSFTVIAAASMRRAPFAIA
jgi:putative transposase